MDSLLAIGAVQCIFLAIVLATRPHKGLPHYFLMLVLGIWGLRFITYWLFNQGYHLYFPYVLGLEQSFYLLDGPLMYIYILTYTHPEKLKRLHIFIHFLPFLLALGYTAAYLFQYDSEEILQLFAARLQKLRERSVLDLKLDETVFLWGICVSILVYLFLGLREIRNYNQKIKTSFSSLEQMNKQWLWAVVISWGVFFGLPFSFFLINFSLEWLPVHLTDLPLIFAFLILIFIPAFVGFKQMHRALNLEQDNQEMLEQVLEKKNPTHSSVSYQKSGLKEPQARLYEQRIQDYINAEKPFLNPDLTLSILAESLRISPNHLSQVLNERFQSNFFDFINRHRVEEVKARLRSGNYAHYTLLALAQDCGFKSKSSFNAAFKKFTQLTPSQFKAQLSNSEGRPTS
ncbi:MAG: helix-turn-helix domain-containing protein [Bacteroidota bacterium]